MPAAGPGRPGRQGVVGPQGAAGAPGTDVSRNLTVNWRQGAFAGRDTSSADVPGIGTLTVTCNLSEQKLTLAPAASGSVRTSMSVTTFQQSNAPTDQLSTQDGSPITRTLPPNGMLQATLSVQPVDGDGGPGPAPATLTLSSEYKVNDPADQFCFVAGQALVAGH